MSTFCDVVLAVGSDAVMLGVSWSSERGMGAVVLVVLLVDVVSFPNISSRGIDSHVSLQMSELLVSRNCRCAVRSLCPTSL